MALEDIIISGAAPSANALPIPAAGANLASIVLPRASSAAPPQKPKSDRIRNTVGTLLDIIAGAGGRFDGYWATKDKLQKENDAAQLAETARLQAEARKMQQDNAFAAFRANPADQGALVDLVASGYEKGPDLYKTLNPQMSASQGSQPREVVIAQMLADPATPQAVRDQLERLVNTPVYRGTPDGGTAALPKLAPGPTATGNVARLMNGGKALPGNVRTVGDLVNAKGDLLRYTGTSTATGPYQITADTWADFGPKALGQNWGSASVDDPQAHDAVGRAIYESTGGNPKRLMDRWEGLTAKDALSLQGQPWEVARALIAQRESGGSGGGIQAQQVVPGQPKPGFTLLSQTEVASIPGLTPGRAYQRDGQGKISAVEGAGGKGAAARAKGLEPGKLADVDMMIKQLRLAESELEKGGVSGPIIGVTPDPLLRAANPRAVDVKETVAAVTQRNLREILGGQFAQKEGEQLINRAYNPGLPEATNLRRVRELRQAIEKRRDDLMGGGSGMVRVTSPEEAARLPAGTQFTTPDGRVMVKR